MYSVCQPATNRNDTATYLVDSTKSYVSWSCDSHNGTVPVKNGFITIVGDEIVSGKFNMLMDSIKDVDIEYDLMRKTLENTLRSEFFFDTENYPESTFEIDYTIPESNNSYLISGDLWITGMVGCVVFNSDIHFDDKTFSAVSDTFVVDRIKWGITIYSKETAKSEESVIVSDGIKMKVFLSGFISKNR